MNEELERRIDDIASECDTAGWDGYEAAGLLFWRDFEIAPEKAVYLARFLYRDR